MNKAKTYALPIVLGLSMIGGVMATYAGLASAQTATTSTGNASTTLQVDTREPNGMHRGHAPMGNDGNVTAINGTTITMQEESDEGGAVYTIDASGATFMKDGATGTVSSIAVGDKIFVKGTVTGNTVVATSVMDGHPQGGHGMFGGHRSNQSTTTSTTQSTQ
jgi:hypothetical protein